jgi:hypothetical protein
MSHSRSQSLASLQSAASIADLDIEAARHDTGITTETIEAYMLGPDENGRWSCTYEDCGKTFGRKENIRSHVQTHLNDRPYHCPQCSSRFVRQHDLKRHSKIHTGLKPYYCLCGNGFARHDALTRHRQRGMCIGAIDGAVRKVGKRGRPRKNRPQSEVSQSAVDAAILAVHDQQPQPQLQSPQSPPPQQQPQQLAQLPFELQPQIQGDSLDFDWNQPNLFWASSSAPQPSLYRMDDMLTLGDRSFDFNVDMPRDMADYQSRMSSDISDASSPHHDHMDFGFDTPSSTGTGPAIGLPSPRSELSYYGFPIPSSTETSAAEPPSPPNDLPGFVFDTSSAGTSPAVPLSPDSSMSPTLAPAAVVDPTLMTLRQDPTLMQDDTSILQSLPDGFWA